MLAGYIDALGFLSLGGFFVSFMSGNSTRFAVGMAQHISWGLALTPIGIILLFVLGVMLGRTLRHFFRVRPSTAVLIFMTMLLIVAAMIEEFGLAILAAPLMAIAMGAANNVFVRNGEVSIGVTYMTGTLVKFGQRLAGRLLGEREHNWLPYLQLWLGLVCGAVLGAFGYGFWQLHAVWPAAVLCATLAIKMHRNET